MKVLALTRVMDYLRQLELKGKYQTGLNAR
ncbi:hypothetical protein CH64_291 [Yersinia rohdei]|uniref:Uncharacterized protein n=1 Tax=Yersinia rohdei TaxID=29485 RepID=A0A0U1HSN6_YERRO|nr:hypothetical protein CH64_291 [Yersinia rohdei]CND93253.1 Uncharacterised protein [Yersinia rohdei]CNI21640.1 Uncharacterised protein [Yersinia rohdei]CQI89956.1 Uncharacterised protein [Yersinia rohdei]CQJ62177.1 Uncharacterised protein [Yersinia rohdei]